MYDVARIAGVSQKTVSRVFNNEPLVSENTRKRVLDAAAQLQFSPNVAARRLATKKSFVIGLVFESSADKAKTSGGFVAEVTQAALSKCHQEGYGLLLHSCGLAQPEDHRALVQLCKGGSVDGLVLTPPLADSQPLLDLLDSQNIKYVECFSSRSASSTVPYVAVDDRQGAKDLTRLLLQMGHRRIAYIKGKATHQSSEERWQGFQSAHLEAGVEIDPTLVIQGDFTFESGISCARELLSERERPTAILAFNDDIASGVLSVAHQMAIKVPEELSIAGFDDVGIAPQLWPPLTTVKQPIRDIITLGTDLLLKLLREEPDEVGSIVLPTKVVERKSVGPAPVVVG